MFCNKVSIELSELFRAAPSKLSGTKNNVHSLVRPIYPCLLTNLMVSVDVKHHVYLQTLWFLWTLSTMLTY